MPSQFPASETFYPHLVGFTIKWSRECCTRILTPSPYLCLTSTHAGSGSSHLSFDLPVSCLSPRPSRVPYSSSKFPLTLSYFSRVWYNLLVLFLPGVELIHQCNTSPRQNTCTLIGLSGGHTLTLKVELQVFWQLVVGWSFSVPQMITSGVATSPLSVWFDLASTRYPEALDNMAKHGLSHLWHPWGAGLNLLLL